MTKATESTLPASVQRVEKSLGNMSKQFESMLPSHINPRKFLRAAVTAVQNTPDLQKAEHESIISSCQKAAADGLVLDGREASLVVFNSKDGDKWVKKAQYMPMVAGILKKARNSGKISSISVNVVHKNDLFDYQLGLNEKLDHKPIMDGDEGELVCAYAVAKLNDGSVQIEVMRKSEIVKIMMSSKSGWDDKKKEAKGIWKAWESEMWRKTVLKRLCKYLPSSTDLDEIVNYDNETFGNAAPPAEPVPVVESVPGKTKAGAAILSQTDDNEEEGELVEDDDPI